MSILGLPGPSDPSAPGPDAGHEPAELDPTGGVRIAGWGLRAAAFAVDILVLTAIEMLCALAGYPAPTRFLGLQAVVAGALFLLGYMTISQVLTHNTIGKYILGIQVVNDDSQAGTPSLGRIVLRETVGRIASQQLFLGYWFARHDPKRQAWSDQMADTVVVMRDTNPYLRRALIAGAAVLCCGALGFAGYTGVVKQRRANALAQQIRAESRTLDQLGLNIDRLRRQGRTLAELQESDRQVLPLMDQYDQGLRQLQETMLALRQQGPVKPAAAGAIQRTLAIYGTLQRISAVKRPQADWSCHLSPARRRKRCAAKWPRSTRSSPNLSDSWSRRTRSFAAEIPRRDRPTGPHRRA